MKSKAKFGGQNANKNEMKVQNIPEVRFFIILRIALLEICAR